MNLIGAGFISSKEGLRLYLLSLCYYQFVNIIIVISDSIVKCFVLANKSSPKDQKVVPLLFTD